MARRTLLPSRKTEPGFRLGLTAVSGRAVPPAPFLRGSGGRGGPWAAPRETGRWFNIALRGRTLSLAAVPEHRVAHILQPCDLLGRSSSSAAASASRGGRPSSRRRSAPSRRAGAARATERARRAPGHPLTDRRRRSPPCGRTIRPADPSPSAAFAARPHVRVPARKPRASGLRGLSRRPGRCMRIISRLLAVDQVVVVLHRRTASSRCARRPVGPLRTATHTCCSPRCSAPCRT